MKKVLKRVLVLTLCVSMLGSAACKKKETFTGIKNKNGVVTVKRNIDYGKKMDPRLFAGTGVSESDIFVAPVEGMTDEFFRGVDVSSYIVQKDAGVKYYDYEGNELTDAGFFNFLADCGINWIRVRVWNDPYDKDGNGYGGGNNDIEKAVAIGKLATNAGMKVLIDFHYSDFWADPSKQMEPKAWDHTSLKDKQQLITTFTTECLQMLKDGGVNVGMVQVGNETNNGIAGESDSTRVITLIKSGCAAVRAFSKDIKIAVHYANPEKKNFTNYCGNLINAEVDFDIFGVSYYPYWHGTLEQLETTLSTIKTTYKKDVAVLETSYSYTYEDGDGWSNSVGEGTAGVETPYEISVQGQTNSVRDVMNTVVKAGGIGVFYWEPAWIPVQYCDQSSPDNGTVYESNKKLWESEGCGWASSYSTEYDPNDAGVYFGGSSWDNQAMFDFTGKPLESLKVFKYVFGGTNAKNELSSVLDISMESGIGKEFTLPATVNAMMTDGSYVDVTVAWSESDIAAIDVNVSGDYVINGTISEDGKTFDIKCNLSILEVNYIKNPGFEEKGMTMWDITGEGIDREEDNNKRNGVASLKFWHDKKVEYTVEQTIADIPAGKYELSAFLQGGDAGSSAVFELYIKVNGEELKASTKVQGWLTWDNPVISNIEIPEGATVVVGVRATAIAGAWGAWDDFTLYAMK